MASIRDVAKKVGAGVGAVSWAPSGTGYAAEDARVKILAIAEKLGYQSNELARNLLRNRTGIIGVVVPDTENPLFSRLLKHMETQLYKSGYRAMTYNITEISNREQDFIDMLRQNVTDGTITGARPLQDYAYLNLNKPVAAMDRDLGPGIPMIHSNHKAGGRMAARFLSDTGYRNVLNFGSSFRVHTSSNDRYQESKQVMEENEVFVKTVEMAWNMTEYDYYCRIMEQYMDIYRDIDGVSIMDIGTPYCLNTASQRGVKVPEKLHIVGYDAVDMTRLFAPELISITQDIPGLATARVDTMMGLLDGKKVEMKQVLPISIQKGGTI